MVTRRWNWTGIWALRTLMVSLVVISACSKSGVKKDAELALSRQQSQPDKNDQFEAIFSEEPQAFADSSLTPTHQPASTAGAALAEHSGKEKSKAEEAVGASNSAKSKLVEQEKQKKANSDASKSSGGFSFPKRRPAQDPIWLGEKMVYEITYFGVPAGDFSLEVMPFKEINRRKVYHIFGNAVSSKVFSLFYRLDDTVESFIDYEGMFSHRFQIKLDESKQTRNSIELNDSIKGQSYYWNRWHPFDRGPVENKETVEIPRFPQDSLSAMYFIRSSPLPPGSVLTFPVVSEGKHWDAVITVVRRETENSVIGKKQAIVLKIDAKYQGILKKQGDSFIWLSDDDRRVLLRIEAKVKIGTVVAKLKSFTPGVSPNNELSRRAPSSVEPIQ